VWVTLDPSPFTVHLNEESAIGVCPHPMLLWVVKR
jgi:hypothetical protein